MANNRIIYQSDALFVSSGVGADDANEHTQLRRVQSANYSLNVSRQDVNQFGQLARIDSLILESPTVSFDTSYYLSDGFNEMALGFANGASLDKGFISGQIKAEDADRNYYILSTPEGVDANSPRGAVADANTDISVIGIGNAFITDYTLDASVGDLPTVSISAEGTNMVGNAGVTATNGSDYTNIVGAGINPSDGTALTSQADIALPEAEAGTGASIPNALRPGDISVTLSDASAKSIVILDGAGKSHVQSISISIPMSRTPIDRLGSKFSFARVVDFPITPTLSISAVVSEIQDRQLTSLVSSDGFISSVQIEFKDQASTVAAVYKLTNVKLDSESFSSSIGPNKTVDLGFSLTIGGPNDTENNIFFSGAHNTAVMGNSRAS